MFLYLLIFCSILFKSHTQAYFLLTLFNYHYSRLAPLEINFQHSHRWEFILYIYLFFLTLPAHPKKVNHISLH